MYSESLEEAIKQKDEQRVQDLLDFCIFWTEEDLIINALQILGNDAVSCRIVHLLIHHNEFMTENTELVITALENGHQAAVRQLVDAPFPALHEAALFGDNDAATLVLQGGMDANAAGDSMKGWTAAHVAACCGHTHTAMLLRDSGADVKAKNDDGNTPMHEAAGNGHIGTVKWLRDNGADVSAKSNKGGTPMHKAARHGHTDTAKWLFDNGADVHGKDNDGRTLMHEAAWNGHTDTAKWLFDNGADVNAKDNDGRTPMHNAARHGHTDTANWLFDNGADVNAKDNDGRTPMHNAARHGHTDTANWLFDNGADVNAKNNLGNTLMHTHIAEWLRDSRAAVDAYNYDGRTPMHLAADTDTAKWLRDSGADVNAEGERGNTPMHEAAGNGHTGTVKWLRDSGADVNAEGERGNTPVHEAARNGHTDTVKWLFDNGANVTAKDNSGKTPMHKAARHGHADTAEWLRDNGDDLCTPMLVDADSVAGKWVRDTRPVINPTEDSRWIDIFECDTRIDEFRAARDKLSTLLAASDRHAIPPEEVTRCRADCCTAAQALLDFLPPTAATLGAEPVCVRGIAAPQRRPPPELVSRLTAAVAPSKHAHENGTKAVARATSERAQRPLAATMEAALRANEECGEHTEVLQKKLHEARCEFAVAPPAADLTAEECGQHRTAAEEVLAQQEPWAGAAGLERRAAALASVAMAVASRKQAQRTVKVAARAVAKAQLDVHSSDDESTAKEAEATLHEARVAHDAALPALLTATAAVQEWATSGEGALALEAFPGDAELSAVCTALFHAEFMADTMLPQTPVVDISIEYPNGLHDAPSQYVYYAGRGSGDGVRPVVLRRLRLDTPKLVADARRQLQDAGRISVGLRACPDAAAGFPAVVPATRWFVATMPGGTTKTPDVWLEFPRAPFGSLAEVLDAVDGVVFTAAGGTGFCMRLVRAVAQLHAAGIRHGDLKPDNVVLWDDSESDLVRPGIIDLLDTAVVGATQTLRGVTLEWLPPEASAARAGGNKPYATRQLDCWQLGRICEAVLAATAPLPERLQPVRAAASALCVDEPGDRVAAAAAFLTMEAAVAGAAGSHAELQWAFPPGMWLCERGAAPGVDFVELDAGSDPAAIALVACATEVGRVVDAVYRLENLRLWHVYAAELSRVAEQAQGAAWPQRLADEAATTFAPHGAAALSQEPPGGPSTSEALLMHGAPAVSLRSIAEGGFDPSYSGFNGALFGAATCLTPLWAKAANEYACLRGDGVFVTRAAVGHVADCLATPNTETRLYRRPPDGHHSVLGDNGTPGAVVAMYRPSQMYPEYLVVFGNDHVPPVV